MPFINILGFIVIVFFSGKYKWISSLCFSGISVFSCSGRSSLAKPGLLLDLRPGHGFIYRTGSVCQQDRCSQDHPPGTEGEDIRSVHDFRESDFLCRTAALWNAFFDIRHRPGRNVGGRRFSHHQLLSAGTPGTGKSQEIGIPQFYIEKR